jgi:3',5'-cyclic AMP phosphodiesterase CpdA
MSVKNKVLAAIALLVVGNALAHAQSTDTGFFMVLADPQMGMFEKDTGSAQETANLDFAVATANRLHPAFVIICGDLVNKGGDTQEIAAFRASIARLDPSIPLHLAAGNHDVGNAPTATKLEAYRAGFGSDYYTFRSRNLVAIVLNSSLMGTKGNEGADSAQLAWLEQQLELAQTDKIRREDIVVFQHIPFFLSQPGEPDQYFNVPLRSRERYLEMLHRFGVRHVFAGHYHRNVQASDSNLIMVTTGAIGKPLGPEGSGLRLVQPLQDWKTTFFELNKLPDRATIQQWLEK